MPAYSVCLRSGYGDGRGSDRVRSQWEGHLFGLENGARRLWYCRASNERMSDSRDDSVPVQITILIPAPDQKTAERYADLLCGGEDYHSDVEEVTQRELFA